MAKWNLNKLSKDDREIDPRHVIDKLDEILKNLERTEFDVQKALEILVSNKGDKK